jgi:hypothetical protein
MTKNKGTKEEQENHVTIKKEERKIEKHLR